MLQLVAGRKPGICELAGHAVEVISRGEGSGQLCHRRLSDCIIYDFGVENSAPTGVSALQTRVSAPRQSHRSGYCSTPQRRCKITAPMDGRLTMLLESSWASYP